MCEWIICRPNTYDNKNQRMKAPKSFTDVLFASTLDGAYTLPRDLTNKELLTLVCQQMIEKWKEFMEWQESFEEKYVDGNVEFPDDYRPDYESLERIYE